MHTSSRHMEEAPRMARGTRRLADVVLVEQVLPNCYNYAAYVQLQQQASWAESRPLIWHMFIGLWKLQARSLGYILLFPG